MMKTFAKRSGIVAGVLFVALLCMGIVYIDSTNFYWRVSGSFIQLGISNTISTITIYTNPPHGFGYNTNDTTRSFQVVGRKPGTNSTGNGASASTSGQIQLVSGAGGDSATNSLATSGGLGGSLNLRSGAGGSGMNSVSNSTGGNGGTIQMTGGAGGGSQSVATNQIQGGQGGSLTVDGGVGGAPGFAATNTAGGAGGNIAYTGGAGGSPTAGWARKGGDGGTVTFTGGSGSGSTRTNGGTGGAINFTGGNAGAAVTSGDSGASGVINITGGSGAIGAGGGTNSNGGSVLLNGGAPGSGAVAGNVIMANVSGGVVIGISNSAVLTNVMFVRTNLDFGSIAAQSSEDRVAFVVAGRTNAIVSVGAPPAAMAAACMFSGWMSNGTVFVRFNNYSTAAIDPGIADLEVEVKAYR